eukprot:CAMPEP_0170559850 /NCGR_PEP_ID=MMETSP0211-20121228/45419_1 /TAXON_ID=311385 /ORGANISM="Pseudokeronopsis sp., Strain OXSARD2" /LENGTH=44 /DNA_ID= /DNA_START= /DNA_END= /DNA_ORIENTATION=
MIRSGYQEKELELEKLRNASEKEQEILLDFESDFIRQGSELKEA